MAGTSSPLTGTILLTLTAGARDYSVAATINASDAGGMAFLAEGTGTLTCAGDVDGTVAGAAPIAIEGTFSGFFDGVGSFEDGFWEMADTMGFGITGDGTWTASANGAP
jgi:hypothetical protein